MMKKVIITLGIIAAATGLYASQVDSVLVRNGYNPNNVDYSKIIDKTLSVPRSVGSIETTDATINTKYEAALALDIKAQNWVESVLLLKEMQRVYPDRADEFEKNIASIKKNKKCLR